MTLVDRMLAFVTGRRAGAPHGGRLIFAYSNGTTACFADPLEIEQRLNAIEPEWASLAKLYSELCEPMPLPPDLQRSRNEKRLTTLKAILKAVQHAFQVTELKMDGSGLTQAEQLALLVSFLNWVGKLKDEYRPLAASPGQVSASA